MFLKSSLLIFLRTLLLLLVLVVVVDVDVVDAVVTPLSLRFENTSETRRQVRSLPFELPNYHFCLERLELLGDAVWGPIRQFFGVFRR